jgi:hypothetical protein
MCWGKGFVTSYKYGRRPVFDPTNFCHGGMIATPGPGRTRLLPPRFRQVPLNGAPGYIDFILLVDPFP